MGRPPTRPTRLKDGFYIEVRSKGASSGVKIRSDSREAMLSLADDYRKSKEVVILGEHRKDKWVDQESSGSKANGKAAKAEAKANAKLIAKANAKPAAKPATKSKAATKKKA